MTPTIGRTVHYFPDDERRRDLNFTPAAERKAAARVWPAIITFVHDREYGPQGEEIGPWLVSLTAFPPRANGEEAVVRVGYVPLAGMYDLEDLLAHPIWQGCWNWPPRLVLDL